jgi:hypothetical protein
MRNNILKQIDKTSENMLECNEKTVIKIKSYTFYYIFYLLLMEML